MNQVEEWFFDIPPITRAYLCGIALVTAGVVISEMKREAENAITNPMSIATTMARTASSLF
jgi:hypothetical protein